ncbi:MAG: TonB family protein [Anaeromyxobacter sp.]
MDRTATPTPRPRRRRDHVAARVALALLVSLLANGLLLWIAVVTGAFDVGKPVKVSQVSLSQLSASDWAKNRGAAAPPPPPPPRLVPVPEPPAKDGGTVVKLAPGPDGTPPKDARFLAERDQTVERETVSRYATGHDGPVLPAPQLAGKPAPQPAPKGEQRPEQKPEDQKPRKDGAKPQQEQLAMLDPSREGLVPPPAEARRRQAGEAAGDPRKSSPAAEPDLTPRAPGLASLATGAPNEDGMGQGLEEGDVTALNTRKSEVAKYLNSFGDRIASWWRGRTRAAIGERDPEARIFFYKDRTAVFLVRIEADGQLAEVRLLQSSNVDFFDQIALSAIRQAAPFPPPPASVLDRAGEFRFTQGFTAQGPQAPRGWDWRPGQ